MSRLLDDGYKLGVTMGLTQGPSHFRELNGDPAWDLKTPHPQPLSQGGRGEQEYSDFTADREMS